MKKTLLLAVTLLIAIYCSAVTVTFKDWDGSVIDTQDVNSGEAAEEPDHPYRSGYIFSGWDKGFAPVGGNTVVTAQYTLATSAGNDIELYWPMENHTSTTVAKGPVEPFAMTRNGMNDKLYSQNNLTYPASYGYDATHHAIMLEMDWPEANSTEYDPYVYTEFSFMATQDLTISNISMLVGSYAWDLECMRFKVMYSINDDFSDAHLLTETGKVPKDNMQEIKQNTKIQVIEGDKLLVRVFVWVDGLPEVFVGLLPFYPLFSEVKFTGKAGITTGIETISDERLAKKTFEYGQLVIVKNGIKYNALGSIVK